MNSLPRAAEEAKISVPPTAERIEQTLVTHSLTLVPQTI
jgi:hypothetical protein